MSSDPGAHELSVFNEPVAVTSPNGGGSSPHPASGGGMGLRESSGGTLGSVGTTHIFMDDVMGESASGDVHKKKSIGGVGVGTEPFGTEGENPPSPQSPKKEEESKIVSFYEVFKYSDTADRIMMTFGGICALIAGAGMPAFAQIVGDMIQDLTGAPGTVEDAMSETAQIMTYVGVVVFFLCSCQVGCWMLSSARQVSRIRVLFFEAVMRQDVGWHDEHKPGELISRMDGDTRVYQNGINDKFATGIYQFGTFVSGFAFGFYRSWELTLVMLGAMPLIALVGATMAKVMTAMAELSREGYANAGAIATEVMENVRTVQAFGQEEHEVQRFAAAAKPSEAAGLKRELASNGSVGVTYFVLYCCYGIGFWFSSYLIEWGRRDVGDVTACFFSVLFASFALGLIFPSFSALSESAGAARKLFSVIDRVPPIDIEARGEIVAELSDGIVFEKVAFAYPTRKDHQLFKKLNVTIKKGTTVAFSGVSGSGKSSIIQMIQRFYDPDGGAVLVDGKDMRDIDLFGWRGQIGIVSQEPSLFAGTIADNVRVGKADATDAEVIEACRKANIHDVIMTLPHQYDTNIGTIGSQLSGGQKQRIAIARAIVKNPKILILDEATSALDRKSEVEVQAALDKVMSEGDTRLTVVVIAHRLATIRSADVIHFIVTDEVKGSTIAESGSYDELVALNGHFAAMTRRQSAEKAEEEEAGSGSEVDAEDTVSAASSHHMIVQGSHRSDIVGAEDGVAADAGALHEHHHHHHNHVSSAELAKEKTEKERKEEALKAEVSQQRIPYLRLLKMNKENLWALGLGLLGSVLSGGMYPAYSVVFGHMIEVLGLKYNDTDALRREVPLWACLFIATGLMAMIGWLLQTFYAVAGEKLTSKLRQKLFRNILRQDQSFFDMPGRDAGALAGILAGDCEAVHQLWGPCIGFRVQMFCNLTAGLVIAFVYSWKLALVTLAGIPPIAIAGMIPHALMVGFGHQGTGAANEDSVKAETFTNIRTVIAFNLQQRRSAEYQKHLTEHHGKQVRNALIMGLVFGFTQFTFFGVFSLCYWYGGRMIDNGEASLKDVMISSMAVLVGAMGAGEAGGFASKFMDAEMGAKRVFNVIDRVPTIDPMAPGGDKTIESTKPAAITVNKVAFSYPARPAAKVLNGFSTTFAAGSSNGFMGSTGCGKSTVIQLLARYYGMTSGSIFVDGKDITTLDLVEWRKNLSIVLQEPSLFSGTVRENIRYSRPEATDAEIEEAARLACIHDDILMWPNGYETDVGYKGRALSGGQKQRVAIARGLLRKPKLLLLDEATSALDNTTEAKVQAGIELAHSRNPMTIVAVAHRLTTIRNADKIVVMDAGVIVEEGSHDALMALNGEYKTRWELYQAGTQ